MGVTAPVSLLQDAVRAYRKGNFQTSWVNYKRLYDWIRKEQDAEVAITSYCRSHGCPTIWHLAWVLEKSTSDLDFLDGICTEVPGESTTRCATWQTAVKEGKAYHEKKPPLTRPTNKLPIKFILQDSQGDMRPWVVFEVGNKSMWGMIDSGRHFLTVNKNSRTLTDADYLIFDNNVQHDYGAVHPMNPNAVLYDFVLGTIAE